MRLEPPKRARLQSTLRGKMDCGPSANRASPLTLPTVLFHAKAQIHRGFTPGHVQYTRNMAAGASTANVAIILIDARRVEAISKTCLHRLASRDTESTRLHQQDGFEGLRPGCTMPSSPILRDSQTILPMAHRLQNECAELGNVRI